MTRDERQALAIEKWKAVKCRGSWCFATGFGEPVGKREKPHAELPKELGISKSGNIGEIPEKENPEINSETKESESSYSVECEPIYKGISKVLL